MKITKKEFDDMYELTDKQEETIEQIEKNGEKFKEDIQQESVLTEEEEIANKEFHQDDIIVEDIE